MAESPLKKKVKKKGLAKDPDKHTLPRPEGQERTDLPKPGENVAKSSPLFQVPEARMKETGFIRNSFLLTLPPSITEEQITDERFFAHIARKLKAGDVLVFVAEDMSWELEGRVIAAGNLYAQIKITQRYEFAKRTGRRNETPYTVEHGGGHSQWRVLRDGQVVRDGFESHEAAERWVKSHMQALNH